MLTIPKKVENKILTIDKWGTLYTYALILMFPIVYREQKELT